MLKKIERKIKYFVIKLLRIKDKAHSIALGFSLGLIINFIPSFGFGPVVSVALARLFRGNSVSGFLGGVSFIWAFPFFFYLNFLVGDFLLPTVVMDVLDATDKSKHVVLVGLHLGKTFFSGMIFNILFFGVLTYFGVYFLMLRYRKRILQYIYKAWLPQK